MPKFTEQEKTVTTIEKGKRYRYTVEGTGHRSLLREGLVLDLGRGFLLPSAFVGRTGPGVLELLPDPLPTTPGVTVTLNGHLYASTDNTMSACRFIGLTGEDRGKWYTEGDLAGATVVQP